MRRVARPRPPSASPRFFRRGSRTTRRLVADDAPPSPRAFPDPVPPNPDAALRETIEPAIAGDHPGGHDAYLAHLRAAASSAGAPCTHVWLAGAVAYRCRTCQTGESSSVCVACFRAGDHEGHDYIMYRSETGGACDCGDLESWARAGCCPAHAPKTTNPAGGEDDDAATTQLSASSMTRLSASSASTCAPGSPSRLVRASRQRAFLGVVVERLVLALECVARTRGPRAPVAAGARRADANARAEVSEGEGGGHRAGAEVRREVGARGCVC